MNMRVFSVKLQSQDKWLKRRSEKKTGTGPNLARTRLHRSKQEVGRGSPSWARPRSVVDRVGGICAMGKPTWPVALEMGPTWGGAACGRAHPWLCEEDGGGGWKNSGGIWDSSDMGRRREWEDPVPGHRIRPEVDEDGEGQHESERRNDGGREIRRTPCGGATRLRGPAEHGERGL